MSWDLNRLFRHHAPAITGALRHRGASAETADDLLQDTFLRVLRTPPAEAGTAAGTESGGRDNPRGYLFRIAYNLLIDLRRRERRLPMVGLEPEAMAGLADPRPGAETLYQDRERLAKMAAALAALPPRAREAFCLHRLEGLTMAETGARMGLSTSRAWGLIHEAYRHLHQRLGEG